MIILNKKKIIIFHNRKTSGTSFGLLMSLISSEGDYIPFYSGPLIVNKNIIRKIKLSKNQSFSNIIWMKTIKNILYNLRLFFLKKINRKNSKKKYRFPYVIYEEIYYTHTTPNDFKKNISNKIYKKYTKFCIYRSFSDQLYSMYNHRMVYSKFISYEKWVSKNLESFFRDTFKFYKKDIYYFNYHKMEASIIEFCKRFNIKLNLAFYYRNIKQRSNYSKYPRILSKKTKQKVIMKEKIIFNLIKNKLLYR